MGNRENGRPSARKRGYTHKWDEWAKRHKQQEPLCRKCYERGIIKQADVADHIVPHKGNSTVFWDPNNLQSLCTSCHSQAKQSEERRGYSTAVDVTGWPTDPQHPANKFE